MAVRPLLAVPASRHEDSFGKIDKIVKIGENRIKSSKKCKNRQKVTHFCTFGENFDSKHRENTEENPTFQWLTGMKTHPPGGKSGLGGHF